MGEEEKKKLEEEKKAMEEKASKKNQPAKKVEEKKQGGDQEAAKDAPPPQEVVLKVFMHCEGCAKKVRRSLKGFPGVEDVIADSKSHKVVVKGEKADPVKVAERIQRKSHRKVELISPIPKPPAPEEEKPKAAAAADKESEKPKAVAEQEKNGEEPPQVITVVLKVHMHCEACSLAIKKRILRMKGVDNVETDLKSSQVTVVGVFEAAKLVDYLHKRTGKQAAIMKQDPPPQNKKDKEKIKEESKKDGNKGGNPKDGAEEKNEAASAEGGDKDEKAKDEKGDGGDEEEKTKLIELKQNEFYYYPAFYAPKFAIDQYHAAAAAHPPQLFSDENPNACSVM